MDKIYAFCQTLYNCTYLPIHYFKYGKLQLVLPDTDFPFDLATPHLPDLCSKEQPVSYLITKEFHYLGLVWNQKAEEMILIGPIISILPSSTSIRNIIREYAIPQEYRERLTELYQFMPLCSFHQFCHFLALFYQELFNEVIDIQDYLNTYDDSKDTFIASLHISKSYEAKEQDYFHNTYHYEQLYLDYIRNGNVDGLKKFFSTAFSIHEGQIADNTLRQAKNILIVTTTLATRCAIEGGLDIESAYQLSDIYIQESENMQVTKDIYQLQHDMMLDFTRRVAQAQIPCGMSSDIHKCIQYIRQHTNQAISTADVAAYIGKSRSYLSRRFKRELGFQMNEFIMRCKLEEAKALLAYTDKPISAISTHLCFSSQSHFQNIFKKKYGITPNTYRQKPLDT